MKIKIEIQCDNAAFGGEPYAVVAEVSAILARTPTKLLMAMGSADAEPVVPLLDSNGNTVGTLTVERD